MTQSELEARGWHSWHTGGGCYAMVKERGGWVLVLTDSDGTGIPEADSDFMLGAYAGEEWQPEDCRAYWACPDYPATCEGYPDTIHKATIAEAVDAAETFLAKELEQ